MTRNNVSFFAPFVLLLSGCATDPIEFAGDPASVPAFRTFKVQEERLAFPQELPEADRLRVTNSLRSAAVNALQGRGYREAGANEKPDVLVVLGAASRTTLSESAERELGKHINPVSTEVFDAGSSNAPTDAASERPPGIGREGDLILYIIDPATQKSLWRASSSGAASTPGEALRKAKAAYRGMVKQLPQARA